jgi:serine/threonine-protein kinase
MHAHLVTDKEFVTMFRDEARIVARIRHPNVVSILDVVSLPDELFLVMEYVSGESLAVLLRRCLRTGERAPPDVAVGIVCGMLAGLHAAHEATSESGAALGIVHRDVSPQNVIVGEDGFARVLDFGIAYAAERLQTTTSESLKGKLEYMAPEQIAGKRVDRRTDVYAAGVVLWETLTGQRLFKGDNDGHTVSLVQAGVRTAPSEIVEELPPAVDAVVLRALSLERGDRQATAAELASDLARALSPAPTERVARWVAETADESLARRRARVREIESSEPGDTDAEPATKPPKNPPLQSSLALAPTVAVASPVVVRSLSLSIPSPPPAPQRSWPRTLLVTTLAAGVVIGTVWYAIVSVRGDFERALTVEPAPAPEPAELPDRIRATRVLPMPSEEPLPVEIPLPSATAPKKPAARTATTGTRKKPRSAHCNPPYVILSTGQKVMKLACE